MIDWLALLQDTKKKEEGNRGNKGDKGNSSTL
jgi:hypothetical protein